ncbi:MAG TPA: hypothetical protein VJL10_04305 [Anaerolineales bacterium]|nr:hypothetical protein [Candidatus Hodarchaeales archaeon]HLA87220.1 hypothetical protein [Anaerolineales bacterium]
MKPITQEQLREIVPDFAKAIREKKTKTAKPAFAVINFRDEKLQNHERSIVSVPIDLLRYRKYNGRIASDVMNYEKLNGPLDEKDKDAQVILRGFLKNKHPEMDEILIKSIEHTGQSEPAIITCDGFLINGNRRKMALEHLRDHHRGSENYNFMKVVILPGLGDEGGPPTLLEIERLENRYQLQSEGKSEYYNFDRALSIKRKMELGFSLEDQLKDDPRYVRATEQELKKAVKQYEREFIGPLECVDRYLQQFDREGMYGTISSGVSDKEGRWQAFLDYSNAYSSRLKNQQWQIENAIDEEYIGTFEEAAFKLIHLRTLKGLPKIHEIMRELPKMCALKESRKAILNIADEVDSFLPHDDQFDADGNPLSPEDIDRKWAQRNQQKMIMLTKRALDCVESSREKETPLMLLEAALKKLTHDDFSVENIPHDQYPEARRLASDIQKIARDIEHQLYDNEKKLKDLARKK